MFEVVLVLLFGRASTAEKAAVGKKKAFFLAVVCVFLRQLVRSTPLLLQGRPALLLALAPLLLVTNMCE